MYSLNRYPCNLHNTEKRSQTHLPRGTQLWLLCFTECLKHSSLCNFLFSKCIFFSRPTDVICFLKEKELKEKKSQVLKFLNHEIFY